MTTLEERYRVAVHSSDLSVNPRTSRSDSDVAGAYGLADKRLCAGRDHDGEFPPSPLSVPLAQFLAGDHRQVAPITETLSLMAYKRSRYLKVSCDADYMARAAMAWYMFGRCDHCGGRKKELIPGTPMLSDRDCGHCKGTGKIPFAESFPEGLQELARWLTDSLEREAKKANPAAKKAI